MTLPVLSQSPATPGTCKVCNESISEMTDLYPKVNKFVSTVQPPVSSFLSYLLTAISTAKQQTVNLSGEFNSDTVTLPIVKSVIKEFIAVNVSDKKK